MRIVHNCFVLTTIYTIILVKIFANVPEKETRILGGNFFRSGEAKPYHSGHSPRSGEATYTVAIVSTDDQGNTKISCSGGIIADRFIISAASCFIRKNHQFYRNIFSIALPVARFVNVAENKLITVNIKQVYVPKSYNFTTNRDNIAVAKLEKPLYLKKNNLIKLRIPPVNLGNFAGKKAVIAGFGWDEVNVTVCRNNDITVRGSTLGQLYFANTKIMSETECQNYHADDIEDTILCAKMITDRDARFYGTCKLDEGGPLVYKSKTIIGILIEVTIACDEFAESAQYTRITTQLDFIDGALQNKTDTCYSKFIEYILQRQNV